MRNVLRDLYTNWEDRPIRSSEHVSVNNKIKTEMKYFKDSMIPDDFARLEALESLYYIHKPQSFRKPRLILPELSSVCA